MANIPQDIINKINEPSTIKSLITVSEDGQPHAIVCGSFKVVSPETIIVGQILMKRSAENMKTNSKVAISAVAGKESYCINAVAKEQLTSGPVFDGMNEALKAIGMQAGAVWVFDVKDVYNQSASPDAGSKIV